MFEVEETPSATQYVYSCPSYAVGNESEQQQNGTGKP